MDEMTWRMFITAVAVIVLVIELYNKYSTARKNAREQKEQREKPISAIEDRMTMAERRISTLESRQVDNIKQIADVKEGQMALCAGVKALLEHELHNGNTDEMESCSKRLDAWLLDRP